jgi:hypothetical protein
MREDSFWKNLIGSFKPDFYKEAAFRPISRAVKYLFLLALIASVVIGTFTAFNFRSKALNYLEDNREKMRSYAKEVVVPISIKKGRVEADIEQPHIKILKESDSKRLVFVIDTTGQTTALGDKEEGLLITEDTLIVQSIDKGTTDIKKYDLSQIDDLSISPPEKEDEYLIASSGKRTYQVTDQQLKNWIRLLFRIGWPVLLVFGYLFTLAGKFIQAVVFSLFLTGLNRASKDRKLSYSNIFNISSFALTAPTALAVVNTTGGLNLAYFNILYLVVYIIYLTLGFSRAKGGPATKHRRTGPPAGQVGPPDLKTEVE